MEKRIMTRVDAKQMYQLTNLVAETYVSSGLTDVAFAAKASADLGFPISVSTVQTAREILSLPSNRDREREAKRATRNGDLAEQVSRQAVEIAELRGALAEVNRKVRILIGFAQQTQNGKPSGLQFSLSDLGASSPSGH